MSGCRINITCPWVRDEQRAHERALLEPMPDHTRYTDGTAAGDHRARGRQLPVDAAGKARAAGAGLPLFTPPERDLFDV